MKNTSIYLMLAFLLLAISALSQNTALNQTRNTTRLQNRTISVDNSVYNLLEQYELLGLTGFLPIARPYNKSFIITTLQNILETGKLSQKETETIERYLNDFTRPVNGFMIKQHHSDQMYTVVGFGSQVEAGVGFGNNGTYITSLIAEPFFAGDIGNNLSYVAGIGASVDRLAPDIFYESYVKDGSVKFPHKNIGYASHPYQFDYETMWAHVKITATSGEGGPFQNELTAGMIYHTELSGSWLNNAIRVSLHNNRRSWGYTNDNLTLSKHARRFHGFDLVISPTHWIRYSMLVGSLFHYANQNTSYKQNIYGYDLGNVQKMLTLHMIEFNPSKYIQFMFTGGNIWSKRFELGYLMPFVFPHFIQIDAGDHDNLSMSLNMALLLPHLGKTWFSIFVDEFSFTQRGELLNMPRNRYAWQWGWKSPLLSSLISSTNTELSYTRVTPFVYTHYPESNFNTFGSERPVDMTYTHDGTNLGFYLPPNSGEFKFKITNMTIPDLKVELDNRLSIHGTNDLALDSALIYGDVYRHQTDNVNQYPLLNFTNDGFYDFTWFSGLKAETRIRKGDGLGYYRIFGSIGYSKTWWKSNNSGITPPNEYHFVSGKIGLSVDF